YGFPTDTEQGFPAQLKGIYTQASAMLANRGSPGTAGVTGGRGASVKRERSPRDRGCFAHVVARRDVGASGDGRPRPTGRRPWDLTGSGPARRGGVAFQLASCNYRSYQGGAS